MLPIDFDYKIYIQLNPDLEKMSELDACRHYILHGKNEKRLYKIDLPTDFNVYIYKEFNPDLQNMSDIEAKKHFFLYGQYEKRKHTDVYFDKYFFANKYNLDINLDDLYNKYNIDIRQDKNNYFNKLCKIFPKNKDDKYIMLVNHDYKMFGASLALLQIYNILRENFINHKIFIVHNDVPQNFYNHEIYTYKDDPTLLYKIYEYINPDIVYINSVNYSIGKVVEHIPKNKLILHSHEIKKNYLYFIDNSIIPDFTVAERISLEYSIPPKILPPFLNNYNEILEKSLENINVDEIKNLDGTIDLKKITICMCGQVCDRKNYKLFIKISKAFPNYNFVWIGSSTSSTLKNVYNIPYSTNPFKYFKQIVDLFVLFSLEDPCPLVVSENILLETPILTFKPNIYYNHNNELITDFYFEYPLEINFLNCYDAIKSLNIQKKNHNTTGKGLEYIKKKFCSIDSLINIVNQKLNNQYY